MSIFVFFYSKIELNSKFAWAVLYYGPGRQIFDGEPWNETMAFSVFDVIMLDIVTQDRHHVAIFFPDGKDQSYSESWGYIHTDGQHRLWTLAFTTAGRYISAADARMKIGEQEWVSATASVYISGVYGAHWFNS